MKICDSFCIIRKNWKKSQIRNLLYNKTGPQYTILQAIIFSCSLTWISQRFPDLQTVCLWQTKDPVITMKSIPSYQVLGVPYFTKSYLNQMFSGRHPTPLDGAPTHQDHQEHADKVMGNGDLTKIFYQTYSIKLAFIWAYIRQRARSASQSRSSASRASFNQVRCHNIKQKFVFDDTPYESVVYSPGLKSRHFCKIFKLVKLYSIELI